ncbi:ThuA domain-containing protein [Virgisporangium ochraceum]|uniref:ThuA-like domain-containing protein n=1 Tax=Virgisporangium ochraceum TaxID=65505 RepID=A0A8J4A6I1_9ACTN|nr:hypothetical protein Voc01_086480 [Virgisporangium ochraceum]
MKRSHFLHAAIGAALLLLATSVPSSADRARDDGARNLGTPDYGVCRGTDPDCYHDWGNFRPATDGYRVLVYSRTAGPRHAHLGPALPAGLNPPLTPAHAAQSALVKLGQDNGFAVDWTEDVTQLNSPSRLFRYNAVIFMSTTRDTLDDPAQTALRQYIRGGGGFVGIHNAFGTEYNWEWYEGLLGGANYYDHGRNQPGTVVTQSRRDVSTPCRGASTTTAGGPGSPRSATRSRPGPTPPCPATTTSSATCWAASSRPWAARPSAAEPSPAIDDDRGGSYGFRSMAYTWTGNP